MPARSPSLSNRSLRVAKAVARRLFDGGSGVPEEKLESFLLDLDDYCRFAGPRLRSALRAGLLLVQLTPLLTLRRPVRFTRLSPQEQLLHLHRLEVSPTFGLPFVGVKTALALLWFEVWGAADLPAATRTERQRRMA